MSVLNSEADSFLTDDHSHRHHHHQHLHNVHSLAPLTIRRHTPGSTDPALQKLPISLQSTSENISSSSNVRVTIKRNPVSSDQPIIQPVLYPVAVYVNSAVPQNPDERPIKEITKPPSPKKPVSPVKPTRSPPISSDRYETESFQLPASRDRDNNVSPRRPVRLDLIPTTPLKLQPERVRSGRMVVEEYDDYEEHYRVPSVYSVPQKVISYRSVPGMTTREIQNDEIEDPESTVHTQTPPVQTITYRTS
jgi:hypothetical protein